MIVRELFAKLGLDVDQSGFIAAERAILALKDGFTGVAGAMIAAKAAMLAIVKGTADYASEIFNLNAATGISTELLQTFGYAAKIAGLELEDSQYAIGRFARNAYQASIGSSEAGYAFYRLGVQAYTSFGKVRDLNELLPEVATAISKVENPTLRDALAMELFGRGGTKMIQALTTIGKDMAGTSKAAAELGVLLSGDVINAGKQLSVSFERLGLSLKGILFAIGAPMLAHFQRVTEMFVHWLVLHRQIIAVRVHEVFKHINDALNGFLAIAMYIVNHSELLKFFIFLAAVVLAVTFPLTALALLLAAIAEDLYLFFTDPKSDTMTGALYKQFIALKNKVMSIFEDFKKDPLGFLYDAAKDFLLWFIGQVVELPGRIVKAMQPEGYASGGMPEAFAQFEERFNLMHRLFGIPDPIAAGIRYFNRPSTPSAPYDASSETDMHVGGETIHIEKVEIHANSRSEGEAAALGFTNGMHQLWDEKMREAQPATKR